MWRRTSGFSATPAFFIAVRIATSSCIPEADTHAQTVTESLAHAEELTSWVAARLHSRFGGQLRDLRITIREDELVLQGRASTYYGKQMAQEVAREANYEDKTHGPWTDRVGAIEVGR